MKIAGYEIDRQIGQGGMATVYHAIQVSLNRSVALKVLHPFFANSPEFSARFLNEGHLLASLHHHNIITIYDIGVSDGFHYISMEYVNGGDLQHRISYGIPPKKALDYVITLGHCLKAAHEADIVHRDVKPANVLFRQDGTLLLTDFGIAKQLVNGNGLTVQGNMIGSPCYLSPEQALGNAVDGRADIYSLGVVFYEMLVGKKPFEGDSEVDVALKHIGHEMPRLPQDLAHFQPLLDRMTTKKPGDRFSDMASMLEAAQILRDTGQWDDSGRDSSPIERDSDDEATAVMRLLPVGADSSAGATLPLDVRNENRRRSPKPRNTTAGRTENIFAREIWELILVVGLLATGVLVGIYGESLSNSFAAEMTSSSLAERTSSGPAKQEQPATLAAVPQAAQPAERTSSGPAKQEQPATLAAVPQAAQPAERTSSSPAEQEQLAKLAALLEAAHIALSRDRLMIPKDASAYHYYQKILKLDPGNKQAREGFILIANRYVTLAAQALDQGKNKRAKTYVKSGLRAKNDHPALLMLQARLAGTEPHVELDKLLLTAQTALTHNRLAGAYYYYRKVLELDPENKRAIAGFVLIADRYLEMAQEQFDQGQGEKAKNYVKLGLRVKNDHPALLALNESLRASR